MELDVVFRRLGIALGLGLLVGLQREKSGSSLAGIRTFGMISAFGAVAALLGSSFGGWIVAVGAACLVALFVVGNVAKLRGGIVDPGQTTEVAGLVMFGVGALAMVGHVAVATALGGTVAVLLHFKKPMHAFVARMGDDDLRVIMQFVLVSLVILPVLPHRPFGPYGVLDPFEIWLMVVLIVGLGLAGFVAHRLFGEKAGSVVGGILGGLVSSTATTLAAARAPRDDERAARASTVIVIVATATMMIRILVEIALAGPRLLSSAAIPIVVVTVVLAIAALFALRRGHDKRAGSYVPENPAELRGALVFGALYAVITLGVAAAKDHWGAQGLYAVAAISGLTDLDAITLSTARTVQATRLDPHDGWRVVLVAVVTNMIFKIGAVLLCGNRVLARSIALPFAAAALVGLALAILLP